MRIVVLLFVAGVGCDARVESIPRPTSESKPGSISGAVRFSGKLPRPRIEQEQPSHIDRTKAKSLIVGEDGALANVFVAIESGLSGAYPAPKDPVRLDQIGYLYEPRVLGVMKDQPLVVRNSDEAMHNVCFNPTLNPPGNVGQPRKGDQATFRFPKVERGIQVKCDVHPWMVAWLHVSDHPYFTVTGRDGKFRLSSVPPGEYEILAWHERFQNAPLVAKVRVESGKNSTLDFTFEAPRK